MNCPSCGKEIIGYLDTEKKEIRYHCIHCNITMVKNLDENYINSIIVSSRWG